jgi:outer membrane protein insertion porin family
MDHSCHVESVVIVGLKRTKEYIVERELGNLKSAASLAEINDRLLEAHDNLTGLGIFDAVDITIDKGKKVTPRNNLRSSVR